MDGGATISACGRYRYRLSRRWGMGRNAVFVMLNPSTADAMEDDPTLRRCMDFAQRWGDSGVMLVNLFAYRATDPDDLPKERELAVGPENDKHILDVVSRANRVICAWGVHGTRFGRDQAVLSLLHGAGVEPVCFGKTKHGHPRHPLYLSKTALLEEMRGCQGARETIVLTPPRKTSWRASHRTDCVRPGIEAHWPGRPNPWCDGGHAVPVPTPVVPLDNPGVPSRSSPASPSAARAT
ncbi:MAG: DUF1643 domain-containing protein, partial [Myxococcaceae bacterium]